MAANGFKARDNYNFIHTKGHKLYIWDSVTRKRKIRYKKQKKIKVLLKKQMHYIWYYYSCS